MNGITDRTVKSIVFDSGVVIKNYDPTKTLATQSTNIVGALSGGCLFTVKEEIYTPAIDGAVAGVKGTERVVGRDARLKGTFIEITKDLLLDKLPGSSATDDLTYWTITPGDIADEDYVGNIAVMVSHSLNPAAAPEGAVFMLMNARGTGELSGDFKWKADATMDAEFVACQDPAAMDTPIWKILLPKEAA